MIMIILCIQHLFASKYSTWRRQKRYHCQNKAHSVICFTGLLSELSKFMFVGSLFFRYYLFNVHTLRIDKNFFPTDQQIVVCQIVVFKGRYSFRLIGWKQNLYLVCQIQHTVLDETRQSNMCVLIGTNSRSFDSVYRKILFD